MADASDKNNEDTGRRKDVARIYGNLLGLRLSLVAFAISSTSEEGIKNYIDVLKVVKEAVLQVSVEDEFESFDEMFADEARHTVQKIIDTLSNFVQSQEVKNEH